MALWNHFKKSSLLPNPNGPLSQRMPSSNIASANKEVENVLDRGDYSIESEANTPNTQRKKKKKWQNERHRWELLKYCDVLRFYRSSL